MSNSKSIQNMTEISVVGGSAGFESIHPLLCPPVLQNIFSNLDLEELKTCRLVCHGWDVISLLQLKRTSSMKPMVRICLTDEKRLQEFLDMKKTGLSECQHFKVTFSKEFESILGQFMNQFKNKIKDVTFVIGKNDDRVANSNFNMTDKFLTFLAQNSSAWDSFGIEIKEESSKDAPSTPFESYEVNWSKLKSLSIKKVSDFFPSPDLIFTRILEKGTELERLVIVDGPPYATYQPLLQNLIATLSEFELIGFSGRGNPYTGVQELIPSFTKLKRLKIWKLSPGYILRIPFLPELCELSVHDIPYIIIFQENAVFPKLTFLDYGDCKIHEVIFKEYSCIFPNLKKLHVRCTFNQEANVIWKYFSKIEELRVECKNVNDSGVIGFYCGFSVKREDVNWSRVYLESQQSKYKQREPNGGIQSLSELKKFTIAASKISNVCVIYGLLKCKSLRSIQLLSPSPYLTKDILMWMADELNLINLSIDVSSDNRDWESSDEAIYFRKKHRNCRLSFPYYPK